jgi:glycosyltransferase involved in cell wall biosynthesis
MVNTGSGKYKVTHVITSLNVGGAEMMLYHLLQHIDHDRFECGVLTLIPIGQVGDKIRALGIPVHSLEMRPGRPSLRALIQLIRFLRLESPDIVHTWMYHADLMGGLAARVVGGIPVVWGIHNSTLGSQSSHHSTRAIVWLLARLSGWLPKWIISCSIRARNVHVGIGYHPEKIIIIPNGFDLGIFHQDIQARNDMRLEMAISQETPLIGMVARYDPQKDFHNFIEAARILLLKNGSARLLLCGKGVDWDNEELVGWLQEYGLDNRFILTGLRDDIPSILNGLDVFSISSAYGEAFPLTVGEAMACGVPCVATNVGDTAYMIGDTGISVPPKNPRALAEGWRQLLSMSPEERHALGERARQRIQQNFNITQIAQRYEALYKQTVEGEK